MIEELFGVGVPTTCGYKVENPDSSNVMEFKVLAYFIIQGFDACVLLESDLYHVFLGYSFMHSTAVPVVIVGDSVYYQRNDVEVFAWGASGA